jgi:hypothetical protein
MPAGYPGSTPPQQSRSGLLIAIVALIAFLALGGAAAGVVFVGLRATKHPPAAAGPLTASTAVKSNRGTVVYSDDFTDSTSGWTTETLPSGTTFSYSAGGYVIVAKGSLDHFATAPYEKSVQQVAISITASQSDDAPVGAGYGVSCWRGKDASELRYDFIITTAGDWEVERRDGGFATQPLVLKRGTAAFTLSSTPLVVEGMCATLADLQTTRLLLFAGTQKLADLTDTTSVVPDAGWLPDLIVTSDQIHPSIVTATRFEVRDLSL